MSQRLVTAAGQSYDADTRFMGGRGPVRITGTSPVTGEFYCVIPEAGGATLSALVGLDGSWSGCELPSTGLWAGVSGKITSITLSSGAAIAQRI